MQSRKSSLREEVFAKRSRLSTSEIEKKSEIINNSLLDLTIYQLAVKMMVYLEIKNEVKTTDIVKTSLARGKKIIVPVTDFNTQTMTAVEINNYPQQLERSSKGLLEPKESLIAKNRVKAKDLDLILVPGIAFDQQGNRIGYGGGYYDRFLAQTDAVKIGLAFNLQLVKQIPIEAHDIKLDVLITEKDIIICN